MAHSCPSTERRTYTRFKYITNATIIHENTTIAGETVDISLKGIHIKAGSIIPPGKTVRVMVFPAQRPAISFSGTIIRAENSCLGIEISEIPVESFSHIRDLIVSKSDNPADIWDEVLKVISYLN